MSQASTPPENAPRGARWLESGQPVRRAVDKPGVTALI
jgi:hypothetical protein